MAAVISHPARRPHRKPGVNGSAATLPARLAGEAEARLLGALLLAPERAAELRPLLAPGQFLHPLYGAAYGVLLRIQERGEGFSWDQLTRDLVAAGVPRSEAESHWPIALMEAAPDPSTVPYWARQVTRWHKARLVAEEGAQDAHAFAQASDPDEYLSDHYRARRERDLEVEADRTEERHVKSCAERALGIGGRGALLPSLFPTLNSATRGGLRTGRVVVIGGAPGAGKTTWCVQQALAWCRLGIRVAILAADEEADGLLIRVGQQLGIAREQLEHGVPEVRQFLAERLAEIPALQIFDAEEDRLTVEESSELLARGQAGTPSVLVVDSIQTVRVAGLDPADTDKRRVDLVVAALKRAAKQHGHLVVATSELSRGAYRSTAAKDRIDDLAAFKESGGVEYGASVAAVLRSVHGESRLVDATIVKNRLGDKLCWRMALDANRASFVEIPLPDESEASEATAVEREAKGLASTKRRILLVVEKSVEPVKSRNEIGRRLGGKVRRTHLLHAVDELLEEGKIYVESGLFRIGPRPPSHLTISAVETPENTRQVQPVPGTGNREPLATDQTGSPVPGSRIFY